jgi:hypothetical protein
MSDGFLGSFLIDGKETAFSISSCFPLIFFVIHEYLEREGCLNMSVVAYLTGTFIDWRPQK